MTLPPEKAETGAKAGPWVRPTLMRPEKPPVLIEE